MIAQIALLPSFVQPLRSTDDVLIHLLDLLSRFTFGLVLILHLPILISHRISRIQLSLFSLFRFLLVLTILIFAFRIRRQTVCTSEALFLQILQPLVFHFFQFFLRGYSFGCFSLIRELHKFGIAIVIRVGRNLFEHVNSALGISQQFGLP